MPVHYPTYKRANYLQFKCLQWTTENLPIIRSFHGLLAVEGSQNSGWKILPKKTFRSQQFFTSPTGVTKLLSLRRTTALLIRWVCDIISFNSHWFRLRNANRVFWPKFCEAFIIYFESIFVNNWPNRISPLLREILLNANRKRFASFDD